MRFLSIWNTVERSTPPSAEEMQAMGGLVQEMLASGKLIATEGCLPTSAGARVRRSGDQVTVTDGPFAETKEVVAGYALLQADSRAEAIALTRRFLAVAGDGICEVRQVYEPGDFDGGCAGAAETESAAATA